MTIAPGVRLGSYEITGPLGEGGMGVVYRATDSKLKREVAIKVLPSELAQDPERLSRFEREARLLAALNHPNVAHVYGFETATLSDAESVHFLAMELVEGEDLAERLKRGAIPVDEALEIARQIAEALEEAHEKGIVHRDLKPANVSLTPDGKVKVLDFGLAKALIGEVAGGSAAGSSGDLSRSPTRTHTGTQAGVILGTASYMSPEQAKGAPVDRRADIWAFGVLLYEMLAGARLFAGDSAAEVLAGVLKTEVSFAALPPATPPGVRRLLRRCLERRPKDRLRDIGDARLELGETLSGRAGDDAAAAPAKAPRARTLRRSAAAAALLLACGAIGFGIARMRVPRAAAPVDYHVLTSEEGFVYSARFASDGETIVYGQVKEGRPVALYSTRADATASRALDTPSADVVGISRSGTMALVLDRRYAGSWMRIGTLAQAELAGGSPRALLEGVYDADVAPDGASFAVVRGDGNEQRLEYPIGTVLHRTSGWVSSPRISRDGRRVAFADHPIVGDDQGNVAVVESGRPVQRLSGPLNFLHGVAWSADGREVVASFGTADDGAFLSAFASGAPPRTLLRTITRTRLHDIAPSGAILLSSDAFSVSVEGRLAAGLTTLPFGSQTEALIGGISEDGGTVVGIRGGRFEAGEYEAFSQRGEAPPVSLGTGIAAGITPDGRRAFLYTLRRNQDKLRVVPIGPGDERIYDLAGVDLQTSNYDPVSCAEDGQTVSFLGRRAGEEPRGYVLDLQDAKAPRAVTPAPVRNVRIAPDGRRLVAVGAGSLPELYDVATGTKSAIPGAVAGEVVVAWSSGSDALFVWDQKLPARVERLDLATGRRDLAFEWRPRGGTEGLYGLLNVTTDARWFLMRFRSGASTLAVARGAR
jgi:hypothetical protein